MVAIVLKSPGMEKLSWNVQDVLNYDPRCPGILLNFISKFELVHISYFCLDFWLFQHSSASFIAVFRYFLVYVGICWYCRYILGKMDIQIQICQGISWKCSPNALEKSEFCPAESPGMSLMWHGKKVATMDVVFFL